MAYTTVVLQTITGVEGEGLNSPGALDFSYTVPQGCAAGTQYVWAGSTVEGMLNITILQNGKMMCYVPVVGATHVPLETVDELQPGAAPSPSKDRGP